MNIKPLDPREIIKLILNEAHATCHLSGTIIPEVYEDLTGLNHLSNNCRKNKMTYPFDKRNVKTIIAKGVTSRFEARTHENFIKINKKIDEVITACPGNIGIFCASYGFLNGLNNKRLREYQLERLITKKHNRRLFKEYKGMESSENEKMVKSFKSSSGAILLGTLGGRNCEGEDFPGKFMETVIIVGFPFFPRNTYINEIISHYDRIFNNNGWLYAYLEPAIRKANQAAGRPIRHDDDKGLIIFLDERYLDHEEYLSEWITNNQVLTKTEDIEGELEKEARRFWNT